MKIVTRLTLSAVIVALLAACSANTPEAQNAQNKPQTEDTTVARTAPDKKTSNSATDHQPVAIQHQVADNTTPQPAAARQKAAKQQAIGRRKAKMAQSAKMYHDSAARPETAATSMILPRHPMITETTRENYADTDGQLNPVYQTRQNPLSTFSIDVDTASYTNVRRMLNQGHWPTKGAVRVEEMINYFNYDHSTPKSIEQPFSVHSEIAPSPWDPRTHLLRIALKGYQVSKAHMPPLNLVFLLDVSGSMGQANKLPLLKQAFSLLTRQLRPGDHVAIVVYAGASGLVLEPTKGDKQGEILAALDKLHAGGSTNGGAGIQLAYRTAKNHFNKNGINRVILATDGDFNVGTTDMTSLKSLVEQQKHSGVFLSILGFGQGNYNDHLMEELSNKGNGNAYYIDSFKEARKVFSDGLTGTLQTIAKDVKIQVEFNPAHVSEYRLIGYDNRRLQREDFNNDRVDAGDIGAGHTVTAFYELVLSGSDYHFSDPLRYQTPASSGKKPRVNAADELAFIKLRYKQPTQSHSRLIKHPVLASQRLDKFSQASSDFQFAAAVAGFGEKLRDSQYVQWSLAQIKQLAMANMAKDTWGYRHEFVQLIANAQVIEPGENN